MNVFCPKQMNVSDCCKKKKREEFIEDGLTSERL